jgi:hypothetical protein
MACHDDGDFGYRGVVEAMYAALLELVHSGFVSPDEARRMVIPTVGRTQVDLVAPFALLEQCGDLSIEHIEIFDGDDVIWSQFEREGDSRAFGARWAAFSRASVFPTLALSLDGVRTDPRRTTFLAQLEIGMAARLAAKPEPMIIPLAIVVLAKEKS